MKTWWMLKGLKILVIMVVAATVFGLVVMLLWNALVPSVFAGPEITFLQAVGLLILAKILFGGFGNKARKMKHGYWRHRFKERLSDMSPEERENFMERCGKYYYGHHKSEDSDTDQGSKSEDEVS